MKVHHSTPYEFRRKSAYPNLADQLDAIWKGGNQLDEMRQKILAIKTQNPKPD